MGEVYRAEDLKLGETVALKFLPEDLEHDDAKLATLLDEVRMARRVSHPNVCRVYDLAVHEGDNPGPLHFLSMEYIAGEDLASLLLRIGRLPKPKALELALGLCSGLAAVHTEGLLHRDIKPGNVMIDRKGRARLSDFGLAIPLQKRACSGGTPAYMAPEQHADRLSNVRTDIYSLGLVLYEIFTGYRAFEGRSPSEYAWLHLKGSPLRPSSRYQDLDPEVERIILGCLEKSPERRPASVEAVAEAVSEIDPHGPTAQRETMGQGDVLKALLICDLVDSTTLVETLGDRWAAELGQRHDRLARDLLEQHEGREIDKTDGFLLLFEHPLQALRFSLDYHEGLRALSRQEGREIEARVGIHFGDVWLRNNSERDVARGAKPLEVEGLAKAVTARLMSLAGGGQTLLSRGAFDLARRSAVGLDDAADLRWLDHGAWQLHGVADPVDVFEVGREGYAPLKAPVATDKVRKLVRQQRVEGWRPAPGLAVPGRPHWQVEGRLGEGGFGEVWLVRHAKTAERRSFKFCFDAERLRALQREITLFRLLKEELGERDDINRILDWNLDQAPYFIESEHTSAGNLAEWAEAEGGLGAVPLETRLELVAQVATALSAAHSVGVLHKDIKPTNVLIRPTSDSVQAQLADFGIGQVTERERLSAAGITVLGMSERTLEDSSSGTGTRLYMAPELLEGHAPTLQADVYALGVMLYQVVVGDLGRALGPGWRRDIDDELLAADIACFVDRSPARRPASARKVAERLRSLDQRRQEYAASKAALQAFEAAHRRRKIYQAVAITSLTALVVVSVLALWAVRAGREEKQARQSTEKILAFMVDVFEITDPFGTTDPGKRRGETITAREVLDRGAERAQQQLVEQPLIQARLMDTFGDIYLSLGLHEKAQPLLQKSLEVRQQLLGEHPDVAASLNHMAMLHHEKGEYSEAISLHHESLDLRQRLLGYEHPETLHSMHDLARSLYMADKLEQAKRLIDRILEAQRRVLSLDHPETMKTRALLAATLYSLGDYRQAKQLMQLTLEIQEPVLGIDHPIILTSRGNLALILYALGDYAEARSMFEQTLGGLEKTLTSVHPITLKTKSNLAATLAELGDYEQARQLLEEVLESQRLVLGPENEDTLISKHYLAVNLKYLGNLEEAEILQEKTLMTQERIVGKTNIVTLMSMKNLGQIYWLGGDYARAREMQDQALVFHEQALPSEHPLALTLKSDLAGTLWKMGEVAEAKNLAQTALESLESSLGAMHPTTNRAAKRLLEIAVDENDSAAVARWLDKLRWLSEHDEDTLDAAELRETRRYVLEVMTGSR